MKENNEDRVIKITSVSTPIGYIQAGEALMEKLRKQEQQKQMKKRRRFQQFWEILRAYSADEEPRQSTIPQSDTNKRARILWVNWIVSKVKKLINTKD